MRTRRMRSLPRLVSFDRKGPSKRRAGILDKVWQSSAVPSKGLHRLAGGWSVLGQDRHGREQGWRPMSYPSSPGESCESATLSRSISGAKRATSRPQHSATRSWLRV